MRMEHEGDITISDTNVAETLAMSVIFAENYGCRAVVNEVWLMEPESGDSAPMVHVEWRTAGEVEGELMFDPIAAIRVGGSMLVGAIESSNHVNECYDPQCGVAETMRRVNGLIDLLGGGFK